MAILKRLFGREYDRVHYESGHRMRHKIGNIVGYLIATMGSLILISIPIFVYYTTDDSVRLITIPLGVGAISCCVLIFHGVSKNQLPED